MNHFVLFVRVMCDMWNLFTHFTLFSNSILFYVLIYVLLLLSIFKILHKKLENFIELPSNKKQGRYPCSANGYKIEVQFAEICTKCYKIYV